MHANGETSGPSTPKGPRNHVALVFVYHYNPEFSDGGSLAILETMACLQRQGKRVTLFSFINHDPDFEYVGRYLASTARRLHLKHHIIPFSKKKLGERPNRVILTMICDELRGNAIDYAVTFDTDDISLLAVTLLDLPGAHFFHSLKNIRIFVDRPQYIAFLRKRKVMAASDYIRKQIETLLGLKAQTWYANTQLAEYAARVPHSGEKTIGYVSSGKHKGDDIVEAIIQKLPHRKFFVAGGRFSLRHQKAPENLEYLGHLNDMRRFYEKIDLLLVPSIVEESFSRVIMEAATNGIPVIANKVGGIPEALGDSGILMDIDLSGFDLRKIVKCYAERIERLLEDKAAYRRLSQKASARANEFLSRKSEMERDFFKTLFGTEMQANQK